MDDAILTYVVNDARDLFRSVSRLERLAEEGFEVHICGAESVELWELADRGFVVRPLTSHPNLTLPAALLMLQAHVIEHPPLLVHGYGFPWAWAAVATTMHLPTSARVVSVNHHFTTIEDTSPPLRDLLVLLDGVGIGSLLESWGDLYRWLGARSDVYLVPDESARNHVGRAALVDPDKVELETDDEHMLRLYDQVLRRRMGFE